MSTLLILKPGLKKGRIFSKLVSDLSLAFSANIRYIYLKGQNNCTLITIISCAKDLFTDNS